MIPQFLKKGFSMFLREGITDIVHHLSLHLYFLIEATFQKKGFPYILVHIYVHEGKKEVP